MEEVEDVEILEFAKRTRRGPLTIKPVELACRAYGVEYEEDAPVVFLEGPAIQKVLISCLIAHYVKQNYHLETGMRGKTEREREQYISLYVRVTKVLEGVF